ncbi:uncharacterized protein LOC134177988 [Corticium candelabrum]|uniref:uncharacterized protein LOC134177988 n=1 Tax=Corticium candelabrum TaxID=121492 RepID=UPI002E26BF1A|nr:uncharacterized protein LOC134177988 [Corticium candelabrum]
MPLIALFVFGSFTAAFASERTTDGDSNSPLLNFRRDFMHYFIGPLDRYVQSCDANETPRSSWQQRVERSALVDLFTSTDGHNWLVDNNWNKTANHCCWYGVFCSRETGLVSAIVLYENNMRGRLPRHWPILLFPELEILLVSKNKLYGKLNDVLPPRADRLQRLTLAFNNFTGTVPWNTLSSYSSLKIIQLAFNINLKGTLTNSVSSMKQLQILSIGQTSIRGSLPKDFGKLRELTFLDIEILHINASIDILFQMANLTDIHASCNRMYGKLPSDIGVIWPRLRELIINDNQLTGNLPNSFNLMKDLKILDVGRNKLTGKIPETVLTHTTLTHLDLSNNHFSYLTGNMSLSRIQVLVLAGNRFDIPATDIVFNVLKSNSLLILDLSRCGLTGRLPSAIWLLNSMTRLNLSYNALSGPLPPPIGKLLNLVTADFSNNNFSGPIPESMSQLYSIRLIDLLNNRRMRSPSRSRLLPWFASPNYRVVVKEKSSFNFTCPSIDLYSSIGGQLLVNSTYYRRLYCKCDRGTYGNRGVCRSCPSGGLCLGNRLNSTIRIPSNRYPSPSARNMTTLIQCSALYRDGLRCNPDSNCSCWLSNEGTTVCNETCLCAAYSTGRLCSECQFNTFKDGDVCRPCSTESAATIGLVTAIVVITVIFLFLWVLFRIRPRCVASRWLNVLSTSAISFQSLLILTLTFNGVIPTYAAQLYFLMIFLALVNKSVHLKAYMVIFLVYLQILDSLNVSAIKVDCDYCSFASILNTVYISRVTNVVNFKVAGIACTFPILFRPVGRLLTLVALPLLATVLLYVGRLIDYLLVTRCRKFSTEQRRALSEVITIKSKSNIVFLVNIFYFPIAKSVVKALLPCDADSGDGKHYMKAYPWIECSSEKYKTLVALGSVLAVAYVVLVPVLFLILLRKYAWMLDITHKEPYPADGIRLRSTTDAQLEYIEWLKSLCCPYKRGHRKYMAVLLMLRRLGIAVFVAAFPADQKDVQSMPFNALLLASVVFVASVRPYRSETPWKLENVADIAASTVILFTYNSMSNRNDVGPATAFTVFAVNILFVVSIVTVAIGQFIYAWKRKRNQNLDRQDPLDRDDFDFATSDFGESPTFSVAETDDYGATEPGGLSTVDYRLMTTTDSQHQFLNY